MLRFIFFTVKKRKRTQKFLVLFYNSISEFVDTFFDISAGREDICIHVNTKFFFAGEELCI